MSQHASPSIDALKHAVTSTATCTSGTVQQLTLLLSPSTPARNQSSRLDLNGSKLKTARRKGDCAASLSKKEPATASDGGVEQVLSAAQRLALATEVANASLKSLAQAVNDRASRKLDREPDALLENARSTSFRKTPLTSPKPLQTRSANILSPSSRKSPKLLAASDDGRKATTALAKCARVAFAALRRYHGTNEQIENSHPLQIEEGMSVLVSKLIALELHDFALNEVQILAKRLGMGQTCQVIKAHARRNDAREKHAYTTPIKEQSLADSLLISEMPGSVKHLSLVITTHFQILRILGSGKSAIDLRAILHSFEQDGVISLERLIEDSESLQDPSKCARQLANLGKCLLTISACQGLRDIKSNEAAEPSFAAVCLRLQVRALQILWKSWIICGHRVNVGKELVRPFRKYLETYVIKSTDEPSMKCATVETATSRISELVTGHQLTSCQQQEFDNGKIQFQQVLIDLYRTSGDYQGALQCLRLSATELSKRGASAARRGVFLCQTALIELQNTKLTVTQACCEALEQAVTSFSSSVDGSSSELDEMIISTSSLRKAAVAVLAHFSLDDNNGIALQERLRNLLSQCILKSLEFLIRYLGKADASALKNSVAARYEQRRVLAMRIARPTAEGVIYLSKMSVNVDTYAWNEFDQSLQKCMQLFTNLGAEQVGIELNGGEKTYTPIRVLVSNVYWSRYLAQREMFPPEELKTAVKQSTKSLMDGSSYEQQIGLLYSKLERLGSLYEECNDSTAAARTYSQAIKSLFRCGVLRAPLEAADIGSDPNCSVSNGAAKLVTRVIEGYFKNSDPRIYGDQSYEWDWIDDSMDSGIRGHVLELGIDFLSRCLRQKFSTNFLTLINLVTTSLLTLYNSSDFPIRRLRFLCSAIECLPTALAGSLLPFSEPHNLDMENLGYDRHLVRLREHLVARWNANLALWEHPNVAMLQSSLDRWTAIICADNINNWTILQSQLGDVKAWLDQLHSISDYLYALGFGTQRAIVLQLTVKVLQEASAPMRGLLVSNAACLLLQLSQLGRSDDARVLLLQTDKHIKGYDLPNPSLVAWHSAKAQYLAGTGDVHSAEENLAFAECFLQRDTLSDYCQSRDYQLSKAQFHSTAASVLLAKGNSIAALYCARSSCRLLNRLWAILERDAGRTTCSTQTSSQARLDQSSTNDDHVDTSVASTQKITVSDLKRSRWKSSQFLPVVTPLIDSLLLVSRLLAHEGLLIEALYYVEQATKIADALPADFLKAKVYTYRGDVQLRAGQGEEAMKLFGQSKTLLQKPEFEWDLQQTLLKANLVISQSSCVDTGFQEHLIDDTYKTLSKVNNHVLFRPKQKDDSIPTLVNQMQKASLNVDSEQRPKLPRGKAKGVAKPRSKKATSASTTQSTDTTAGDLVLSRRLQGRLLRLKARKFIELGKLKQASVLLEEANAFPMSREDSALQSLQMGALQLKHGLECLQLDPVLSIITESTLAHPSTIHHRINENGVPSKIQPSKRKLRGSGSDLRSVEQATESCGPTSWFFKCFETCHPLPSQAHSVLSSSSVHFLSDLFAKSLLLGAAISPSLSIPTVGSSHTAYGLELSRCLAFARERLVIDMEKKLSANDEAATPHLQHQILSAVPTCDSGTFQTDYIDIIPEDWTAVSISISECQNELRLCKLKKGNSPFVMCIPLNRSTSREADEDAFVFDEGKAEMKKIIELANFSTHEAGDLSRKGAKTTWWEARAALDSRLRDLLINIENIWLGGFKGMLCHSSFQPNLLSRFQQSLLKSLDKHLPSRRQAKSARVSPVILDPRVIELFICLGNPSDVENIHEPILDLLYFVVDILQFHGERNAYDEIDFDSMTIEVQDALTHYHELAKVTDEAQPEGHTILILDKKLHTFPWESLPYLSGRSVSRLPSLHCLRERILQMSRKEEPSTPPTSGIQVDSSSGAYVLNPSSDLQHTQATFSAPLSTLTTWSAKINAAPTESELTTALSTKSIYLYFGHGSGGQYIRSRTIRKLDRCAVALLMGCSSATLTEAGEFESYGVPINYLHAGAPAVVGTLWDVTDKDIDRFSVKVLERWGLFAEQDVESEGRSRSRSPVKGRGKAKGKGKEKGKARGETATGTLGKVSLDRAVAEGREECIFRYLNGAAPVVYGIPVYLS